MIRTNGDIGDEAGTGMRMKLDQFQFLELAGSGFDRPDRYWGKCQSDDLSLPAAVRAAHVLRLARLFSKEGIVVAEYTDTLDVYKVVSNVVRSLTQDERFHCDFYRARGEAEVLIANYQPTDRTRIVYDVMLKDIPLRGLTIAEWKQRLG
jgi:hypothetical protein